MHNACNVCAAAGAFSLVFLQLWLGWAPGRQPRGSVWLEASFAGNAGLVLIIRASQSQPSGQERLFSDASIKIWCKSAGGVGVGSGLTHHLWPVNAVNPNIFYFNRFEIHYAPPPTDFQIFPKSQCGFPSNSSNSTCSAQLAEYCAVDVQSADYSSLMLTTVSLLPLQLLLSFLFGCWFCCSFFSFLSTHFTWTSRLAGQQTGMLRFMRERSWHRKPMWWFVESAFLVVTSSCPIGFNEKSEEDNEMKFSEGGDLNILDSQCGYKGFRQLLICASGSASWKPSARCPPVEDTEALKLHYMSKKQVNFIWHTSQIKMFSRLLHLTRYSRRTY